MNLKEQTYVTVLAQCQTLTKAAELLFISPSSLSEYISNLEKQLGTPLFERSNKKFSLTFIGEKYVAAAKKMLEINHHFAEELQQNLDGNIGFLRLGVQLKRGPIILPAIFSTFAKEFPGIELEAVDGTNGTLLPALLEQRVDIIEIGCNDHLEGLCYEPLFTEPILVALNAQDPLCQKAKPAKDFPLLNMRDLKDATFITGQSHQSIRGAARKIWAEANVKPKKIIEIRSIETAVQMAGKGLGIAFTRATYEVDKAKKNKNIRFFQLDSKYAQSTNYAVWLKTRTLTPALKRIIELMKKYY